MMEIAWNDREPIYRQLYERLVVLILDGTFPAGESLPSVRQVAAEHRINPLTVSKAYQLLVDDGVVEKRRGLGMFVTTDAASQLMQSERRLFLDEEWPSVREKIMRLGLSAVDLLETLDE